MRKLLRVLAWTTGVLAVLVLLLRLTFLRLWTIPEDGHLSASLAPSLAAGDIVIVLFRGERGFGDLVRCPDPEDPQRWVVGRIVGLEGDKVRIERGTLTVNGRRYDTQESCDEGTIMVPHPRSGHPVEHSCARVELGDGWHFRSMALTASAESPREHTVGPGRVFLLSDNRTFHDDSRDFGAVPKESCTEQILFRVWGKEGFFHDERRFVVVH